MIDEAIEKLLEQGPAGHGSLSGGVVTRDQCPAPPPLLSPPPAQGAPFLCALPPRTHQAAAEVHQARLRKSAMVGCGGERGVGCRGCPRTWVTPPQTLSSEVECHLWAGVPGPPLPLSISWLGIIGAHHKDTTGCSTQVAGRLGGAGCLIVVGLFAGVEGVVVECQHQVGIDLTEEPAHLGMPGEWRSQDWQCHISPPPGRLQSWFPSSHPLPDPHLVPLMILV